MPLVYIVGLINNIPGLRPVSQLREAVTLTGVLRFELNSEYTVEKFMYKVTILICNEYFESHFIIFVWWIATFIVDREDLIAQLLWYFLFITNMFKNIIILFYLWGKLNVMPS